MILVAGAWVYYGYGSDSSSDAGIVEVPVVDSRLIPLRLPGEVGNADAESHLVRLGNWGNPSPEAGPSPIMARGYWE